MGAVSQIESALKNLYNIESKFCAENFLITHFPPNAIKRAGSRDFEGALYIQQSAIDEKDKEISIELGIYLSNSVREQLETFSHWATPWTLDQLKAFSVASEEISHFHYLIYNLTRNRPLTEFELELQGEIDRFLLLFFCKPFSEKSSKTNCDDLFEQLFCNYTFAERLTRVQRQRYEDASSYAKRFVQKIKPMLIDSTSLHKALKQSRLFYEMDLNHKIAFLHRVKN